MANYTFRAYKGRAQYTATCKSCGKQRVRTVTVEHTCNPFNKNDDGSVRTATEVWRRAQAVAAQDAAKLNGSEIVCQTCERAALVRTSSDEAVSS